MPDFLQSGPIATLHRLGRPNVGRLETGLLALSSETRIALVLPCHVRDLDSPALAGILRELGRARYIDQIVAGIDGADTAAKWRHARRVFAALPRKPMLLWNDGPRITRLRRELASQGLGASQAGKGRNVWLSLGCVLACERASVVAMHDCDIVNYTRELPARLCFPVASANVGFDFCKGYYARVSDRLHGRVTRLLFTPLVRALTSIVGPHPLLSYLESYRYPLAGEVAMHIDQARRLRVPLDWALELGILAEAWRNCAPRAICQAELCDNYEHKHQSLSPRDPSRGLHKVAREVALAFLRLMSAEGAAMTAGLIDTLLVAYRRHAEEALRLHAADALINSLQYPRHDEALAVTTFVRAIREAGRAFLADPLHSPLTPGWDRVQAAVPDFLPRLRRAIEADNAGVC